MFFSWNPHIVSERPALMTDEHKTDINRTMDLVEMAMSYSRSRVLCAAARLGLADALRDEECSVEQLADQCGAAAGPLYRLLRALASVGIVAQTAPGSFVLTPAGQPLRKDAPNSQWAAVVFWADLLADPWSYMTECVRTGEPAARIAEREQMALRWSKAPDSGPIFRAVMGTAPAEDYLPIAKSWDFEMHSSVADLGGGGGALLMAVLRAYPRTRGMLVDRQASIDTVAPRIASEGLSERCQLIAADLIEAVPAGADVYMLKHVLHGYDDDRAVQILNNCRAAMPQGGRLLIIEFVIPAVIDRPDPRLELRLMSDLNMLAVTGGKERSEVEWKELLARSCLHFRAAIRIAGDPASIIEASL